MYESDRDMKGMVVGQECKPDYEEMASTLKKRIDVYERFKDALVDFIQVIGRHSMNREPSSLAELLGKVELDCIYNEKEYNNLLSKIESSGS